MQFRISNWFFSLSGSVFLPSKCQTTCKCVYLVALLDTSGQITFQTNVASWHHVPTEHFADFYPQIMLLHWFYVLQKRRSRDFDTLELWNVQSGSCFSSAWKQTDRLPEWLLIKNSRIANIIFICQTTQDCVHVLPVKAGNIFSNNYLWGWTWNMNLPRTSCKKES